MSPPLIVLLFFLLTLVWLVLAFLPGIVELRRKTDVAPLRVVPESEVDIRFFARNFRQRVVTQIEELLRASQADGQTREGVLEDEKPYVILPGGGPVPLADEERKRSFTQRLIFVGGDVDLSADGAFLGEIYTVGDVEGGARNIYRAVLADGDLRMGDESCSLRWLHAGGEVGMGEDCTLFGRVSADGAVKLAAACRFERLNAPRIEFGQPPQETAQTPAIEDLRRVDPRDLPNVVEMKAGRCLVLGNLELPAGSLFEEDLVVQGKVRIGAGSRLLKSLKSRKDMNLSAGVVVEGSVVSGRGLEMGRDCRVHGPLLAERRMIIGENCLVGSEERPTTLSAEHAEIGCGTVVHGTVWAHRFGSVLPARGKVEVAHA